MRLVIIALILTACAVFDSTPDNAYQQCKKACGRKEIRSLIDGTCHCEQEN